MTGLEETIEVMKAMMNSICDFLTLTMESNLDFVGALPTLNLSICVREDNRTMCKFYFKALASNIVLQQRSAMPENMRTATLNQEVIRRMVQTSENLYVSTRLEVINSEYAANRPEIKW